jgi:peptide chain release factor subunit 1
VKALGKLKSVIANLNHRLPANGLVVFVAEEFELTWQPTEDRVTRFTYECGKHFKTDMLQAMSMSGPKYGFVVLSGHGCMMAILQGSMKTILLRYEVKLPSKHARGGQSEQRFKRLVDEARHNYLTKCHEYLKKHFLQHGVSQVAGLIICGNGTLKCEFQKVCNLPFLGTIDVSGEMMLGLEEGIRKSESLLNSIAYLEEDRKLRAFFEDIAKNDERAVYGFQDVVEKLETLRVVFVCSAAPSDGSKRMKLYLLFCSQNHMRILSLF